MKNIICQPGTYHTNPGELYKCRACGKESDTLPTVDVWKMHMGEAECTEFTVKCPSCGEAELFDIIKKGNNDNER